MKLRHLDKADHHTDINICVELGKSLLEIKQLLEKTHRGNSVSIDCTDIFRRFLGPTKLKMTGRHTLITNSLTLNLLNSLQDSACQTVRDIALRNSTPVATAHLITYAYNK